MSSFPQRVRPKAPWGGGCEKYIGLHLPMRLYPSPYPELFGRVPTSKSLTRLYPLPGMPPHPTPPVLSN